jgi:arabinan endo-1,5-alpha-L-arabinosidase
MTLAGLAVVLGLATPLRAAEPQPKLKGDTRIHDPSVVEVERKYAAFGTGEQGIYRGAIRVKTSSDGVNWTDAGAIGKGAPKWGMDTLGYQPLNVWAPSISRHGGVFYLYYSLSSFGGHVSAIGLMTNASFDPEKPDQGLAGSGTDPDVRRAG